MLCPAILWCLKRCMHFLFSPTSKRVGTKPRIITRGLADTLSLFIYQQGSQINKRMLNTTTKPSAAILARCSSEANVCNQVLLLRQYASERYQVEPDDIYGDQVSGASALTERPELQRLMQNIEAKKKVYAVVLVQDRTRLGKSSEQVQELVDWFTQRNIPLQFQQENQ